MILWLATAAAVELDLATVRDEATRASIAVEQAAADVDRARADTTIAIGSALPQITGFASANTGQGFTSFGFRRPVQNQVGVGVRGRWLLLAPSQWSGAAAARQDLRGRQAMQRWSRLDARREATGRYAAAWAAQRVVIARERAVESTRRTAEAVSALVTADIRPRADRVQAKAEAATAEAELASAIADAEARCAELLSLVREDVTGSCELAEPVWGDPLDGPASHPSLDAAAAAVAAAKASLASSVTAFAPTIEGSGTVAWYQTDSGGGLGWNAGLEATVPLDVGTGAAIGGSNADLRWARLALEDQELALRTSLRAGQSRYDAALTALTARDTALEASEEALTLVEERYRNGTASLTAWMDARRVRDAAAITHAAAEAELGIALAELEAARGVAGSAE